MPVSESLEVDGLQDGVDASMTSPAPAKAALEDVITKGTPPTVMIEAVPQGEAVAEAPETKAPAEETPLQPSVQKANIFSQKCGVCKDKDAKYKCTRCPLPFCSALCSTIHKASHPTSEPKPATDSAAGPTPMIHVLPPRPGTVAAAGYRGLFAPLDDSQELKVLFKMYPQLPKVLDKINTATLPPVNRETENDTTGGYRKGKPKPWTQDRGFERGRKVLSDLRNTNSKDGEGVREYYKLVLQILAGDREELADRIQKELSEQNKKAVEKLLEREI